MTTGVYLDEATTDPSQRYKISTGTNGAGGIATSPDGLTWTNNKDLEKMTHARWDTPKNTVWDPINKQCMYTCARTRVCVCMQAGRVGWRMQYTSSYHYFLSKGNVALRKWCSLKE